MDAVGSAPAEWWGLRVDLRCLHAAVDPGHTTSSTGQSGQSCEDQPQKPGNAVGAPGSPFNPGLRPPPGGQGEERADLPGRLHRVRPPTTRISSCNSDSTRRRTSLAPYSTCSPQPDITSTKAPRSEHLTGASPSTTSSCGGAGHTHRAGHVVRPVVAVPIGVFLA